MCREKIFGFFMISLLFLCCDSAVKALEKGEGKKEVSALEQGELSDALVIETINFEEKKRLGDLREESKEEFHEKLMGTIAQQREYLSSLREEDPEQFEEILLKARSRMITRKIKSREQDKVRNSIKRKKKFLDMKKISFSQENVFRGNGQPWSKEPLTIEEMTEQESNLSSFFEESTEPYEEEAGAGRQ